MADMISASYGVRSRRSGWEGRSRRSVFGIGSRRSVGEELSRRSEMVSCSRRSVELDEDGFAAIQTAPTGRQHAQQSEPRWQTSMHLPASNVLIDGNVIVESVPTSTMPNRTQSAARVVPKEPVFEPTARTAVEAKHEPRLNALMNREPDPEENNPE
ncbi:uncharacterized protein BDZ99DRAFT_481373 [Mytilinidion resinicola]|uniref:Uncharacterized protein n=1 Tax=Mytilinidion resinicola TaxID=574789 RepID=A0A6A6Y5X2_9PEZI|nr:uncharacterized protein BDZ99DRAFT_481373 [Mytilinidion resinicola]KAF2804206.1 hypothetical protein BDZ99DRAFT_481373 [Mytilinidion resinicola]